MAIVVTEIEFEIMDCNECMIFDRDKRSVRRKLKRGWDPIVWTVHIPEHVRIVACRPHEAALIERGGWDGTGDRQ